MLETIDVALLDGSFFSPEELPGRNLTEIGHPTMRQTMELLEPLTEKGPLRVLFTHLNHSNPALDPQSEAAVEIRDRGFDVAYEGQELPL